MGAADREAAEHAEGSRAAGADAVAGLGGRRERGEAPDDKARREKVLHEIPLKAIRAAHRHNPPSTPELWGRLFDRTTRLDVGCFRRTQTRGVAGRAEVGMVTRGFVGRRPPPETGARLPPGQYRTDDFPILQIGPNPTVDRATWRFTLRAGSRPIKAWGWEEFEALPRTAWQGDIHCVTTWSKLGVRFREGRRASTTLLADAGISRCRPASYRAGGILRPPGTPRTCRWPIVTNGQAWVVVATRYDGPADLARDHGGPARLLVPHLYFWKSAKWGEGPALHERRHGRLLGTARLPHVRGSLAVSSATPVTEPIVFRWHPAEIVAIAPATPLVTRRPAALRPGGHVPAPGSTSMSGSPRRTAIRPSAATPSPPRRTAAAPSSC